MSGEFLSETLEYARRQIADVAVAAGRKSEEIRLVAVSKTRPPKAIESAISYGQVEFGENYVQEWCEKADALAAYPQIKWHIVGNLQSNKVREVVGRAALIHSVDRVRIIDEIAGRADEPQPILIQVNIADEEQKSGCRPEEAINLVRRAIDSGFTPPLGLMGVPPAAEDPEDSRIWFRKLRELRDEIREILEEEYPEFAPNFKELSMGMSHDLKQAIEEGATIVRIGTAIFGARPMKGAYERPIEDELPAEMR